jgi:hypothetical protein
MYLSANVKIGKIFWKPGTLSEILKYAAGHQERVLYKISHLHDHNYTCNASHQACQTALSRWAQLGPNYFF